MDRTLRAVLLAVAIGFGSVAGIGLFLGFATGGSLVAGLVAGALAGVLLWGVSRRAESFHPMPGTMPGVPPDDDPDQPDDPGGRAPRR